MDPNAMPGLGRPWLLHLDSALHTSFPLLLCLADSYASFKGQVKWSLLRKAFLHPTAPWQVQSFPSLNSLIALRSTTYSKENFLVSLCLSFLIHKTGMKITRLSSWGWFENYMK